MANIRLANIRFPKSMYRVYECQDVNDCFSYEPEKCLMEHENLGNCHSAAHGMWLKDKTKAYTIIQPYDGSCRGGCGAWADAEDAE
jgi:hypothetical protein